MADSPNASSGATARWRPSADARLERFGSKFSPSGSHSSRTMMLAKLEAVLAAVREPMTEQLHDGPVIL